MNLKGSGKGYMGGVWKEEREWKNVKNLNFDEYNCKSIIPSKMLK